MAQNEKTQIETKPENDGRRKLTFLVFLASVLSLGSIIYTTYSLLDLYQVGGIDLNNLHLRDLSPTGLSAAITADIAWSATMYAEYRGVRLMVKKRGWKSTSGEFNAVPVIGWIEVLLVTSLLAYHGSHLGNGAAAFAAALPIFTKLAWIFAMADLKDPAELTVDDKLEIAETRRLAAIAREKAEAESEKHEAEMVAKQRQNEAELAELRAEAEKKKLAQETENELKLAQLKAEQNLKLTQRRMTSELQIDMLRSTQQIEIERLDAETEMRIRNPRTIQGEFYRQPQLTQGPSEFHELTNGLPLTESQIKQVDLARQYYTVDAQEGGRVTKAEFCRVKEIHPPRLSEATKNYSREWFVENGLADWSSQN